MNQPTFFQLRCFDAVAREGSFQAAAARLGRSHPSVFDAVKKLEAQVGLALLDRSGYRATLSGAGRAYHSRARALLDDMGDLQNYAARLAMGEESALNVVIGDICPLPEVFSLLKRFFDEQPATRLHLHFEAITGPWERLADGDADLILHHIDKADASLEFIDLVRIQLIPVVAPNFLRFAIGDAARPEQMRDYVQCVVRDTARHSARRDYYLIEGAPSWTVSDQLMKKEVIVQGMGWGHMPDFLVRSELAEGRLISIAGKHFRGGRTELVAARRRNSPHGPVASRLWEYLTEQAPSFRRELEAPDNRVSGRKKARGKSFARRR